MPLLFNFSLGEVSLLTCLNTNYFCYGKRKYVVALVLLTDIHMCLDDVYVGKKITPMKIHLAFERMGLVTYKTPLELRIELAIYPRFRSDRIREEDMF